MTTPPPHGDHTGHDGHTVSADQAGSDQHIDADTHGQAMPVKSWEVVYLPSAETMRVTPDQGPSRA